MLLRKLIMFLLIYLEYGIILTNSAPKWSILMQKIYMYLTFKWGIIASGMIEVYSTPKN